MPTWPVTLPQSPLLNGFNEQKGKNVIRTSMEAGPPNVRRRFTARIDKYELSFLMTLAQVAIFETFYVTDLEDGSVPVTMPHPRTGVSTTFRILNDPEVKYEPVGGNHMIVGFAVESIP